MGAAGGAAIQILQIVHKFEDKLQIAAGHLAAFSLLCAYRYGMNEEYAERERLAGSVANGVIVGRNQRTPVEADSSSDA
ncbi:hypothetical protein [Deinococcus sp. RIT780]|uniref:hypothetical protein n=1 Tax=Deinococcus sp. RIT780 TaxID=2870472 RepID=UPI001C8A3AC2|nr:hypothetical protein [Deinococcus sp. RIT780]MBX8467251.1 hypothetical protein [Deinococcus sp. RIT780]